jgi:heme a synthase
VTAPSPGYRRLAVATAVATFLLIVVGGVVRVSDSGLGCGPAGSGFNGWPLCKGDVIPGLDLNTVVEYAHRTLASIVGIMIIALAVLAWRRYREQRGLVRAALAGVLLVLAQGLLGAATVEGNLEEGLVAAHLGLAMLMLGVLLYVVHLCRPPTADRRQKVSPPSRGLFLAASTFIFLTIVAGGYMAGTQNYGRADYQLGDGAHHACGKEFPTCNGDFMPFGQARLVDIHLTHRAFMYIATLLVLVLAITALRRRVAVPYAWGALGLLAIQLLVGALNVWLDEYEVLIVAHLTLGTLLWSTLVGMGLQLYRVPAAAPIAQRAEAVPA